MQRRLGVAIACLLAVSVPAAAQQSERLMRNVKLGQNGRVSITNVSGDITVTGGPGDEVSIEAVKRTNGNRAELAAVQIEVTERPDRVEVSTNYPATGFFGWNERVRVDYTVTVPATAAVDLRSVSGTVKVADVKGTVRARTISGDVSASNTPKLEQAKTVSGNIELTNISADDQLAVDTISGRVHAMRLKAHSVDVKTISGRLELDDVICDRFSVRAISGAIELTGALAKNGRYDINSHSGPVRLLLPANAGFELDARTFSGSVRSEFVMTVGGDINQDIGRGWSRNRSMHGTAGDGSAQLTIHTFSGDVVLAKR